ncbi:MAG TPA: M1 family metallopeptidase [Chitinophagaceae bacterium]|nr:M1 family metallopeptidase [Chitinophagaceae bacterium]
MKRLLPVILLLAGVNTFAQIVVTASKTHPWTKIYRASAPKINDLVDTKLDVRFDYDKQYLYGKEWVTLRPHFYPTDSLSLDAKGMNINEVALLKDGKKVPLHYTYDSLILSITLDKTYKADEKYTLYIDYVSKPNERKEEGSAAITDAKGLYFINPKGEEKDKPTQIWTQGETESNSAWFPTIDKPDQKTTEQITMTVPDKYVTLSNGLLISQKKNADGTRTDVWKLDLPNAPYLFFMGVGDYAIIKDSYKGKEVNYYVEKEYAPVARRIFGLTPEMIKFFSERLNYEYPWPKYDQVTGRDYVSGAMENTTATLHTDALQQNARELVDGNKYEDYISHELFHQWFGDLVTCESWSNITVNESFADYSEYLWREYKYGKDNADEFNYKNMQDYLNSGEDDKDLVRFYYKDKEDVFDDVSYAKGGRILNMLRHFLGDDAFFKGLNLYLTINKFGNGEAHQLRLALEQVSGKDLNWFFNQWYFGAGQPNLTINYGYDAASQTAKVYIQQKQEQLFHIPLDIDVYDGNNKTRYSVWMNDMADTFAFHVASKPDLVNVDADKTLLCQKDDNKTLAEYIFQYKHAGNYVDRREAVDYCLSDFDNDSAKAFLLTALNDPRPNLRKYILGQLTASKLSKAYITAVETMAKKDTSSLVQASAISLLGDLKDKSYADFFEAATKDSSYTIAGEALSALAAIDAKRALALLPELKKDARGNLANAIEQLEITSKTDADFDEMITRFTSAPIVKKFDEVFNFITYLNNVNDVAHFKTGVDTVISFRDKSATYGQGFTDDINNALRQLRALKNETKKETKGSTKDIKEEIAYLDEKVK